MVIGIYVHIPFCRVKCPYCDFYSVSVAVAGEEGLDAYTDRLCRAMEEELYSNPVQADTLYLGGGTPVLLGERRLHRILETAVRRYRLEGAEITLEANPGEVTGPMLKSLRKSGYNRISFGLQSAQPEELCFLGRKHSAMQGAKAVELARTAGFENISLDLMLGLAGQTEQSLGRSVAFCAGLGVEHLSAYLLKVEPGTLFARRQVEKLCPDEEKQAELYQYGVGEMEGHGYRQYEISNFAKPGFEGRHNLKYWKCQEYLGLGAAAHSFAEGVRYSAPRDWKSFVKAERVKQFWQAEGLGGDREEGVMLGLRLTEGITREEVESRKGDVTWERLMERAKPLAAYGLMEVEENSLRLTVQGFLVSNQILGQLLF